MSVSRDEILDAALKLTEADRLLLVSQLMDTLPDDLPGLPDDDPTFLEELERRAKDSDSTISASELWNRS
jgi:hypothetical protein